MYDIFKGIPLPQLNIYSEYNCGDGAYMVSYSCDAQDYYDFCKTLEKEGLKLYQQNDIEGNLFRVYCKGVSLYIHYSAFEKLMRITAEDKPAAYNTEPVITDKHPVNLWQFEVDHSLIDCGMCYIVRCDDGSFFVVDSAHYFSVHDDVRIINFLKKISGEEKPRVAGWFLTHAHDDHICKFTDILRYHCDEIIIEAVYYNFPIKDHKDAQNWDKNYKKLITEFENALRENPQIKKVKLHSGMRFFIRNLQFDVLCTHEDIHPNEFTDFNNTSTCVMMRAAGSKVCFPGDCSAQSDKILLGRYNRTLECDVMQISHHGHSGLSPEFYRRAKAKCALFPITLIKYDEEWPRQDANFEAVNIAMEAHIASEGTVEIPLPYKYNQTIIYPDETFEDFTGIKHLWGYEYTDERKEYLRNKYLEHKAK